VTTWQDAVLQLSAVILPDGMQRIRGHEDQLQMRSFYQEADLISAEVQNTMVRIIIVVVVTVVIIIIVTYIINIVVIIIVTRTSCRCGTLIRKRTSFRR
jgi:hypothetical protein